MKVFEANAHRVQSSLQPEEDGNEGKRDESRPVEYPYHR